MVGILYLHENEKKRGFKFEQNIIMNKKQEILNFYSKNGGFLDRLMYKFALKKFRKRGIKFLIYPKNSFTKQSIIKPFIQKNFTSQIGYKILEALLKRNPKLIPYIIKERVDEDFLKLCEIACLNAKHLRIDAGSETENLKEKIFYVYGLSVHDKNFKNSDYLYIRWESGKEFSLNLSENVEKCIENRAIYPFLYCKDANIYAKTDKIQLLSYMTNLAPEFINKIKIKIVEN